jgi:hypothetical protein
LISKHRFIRLYLITLFLEINILFNKTIIKKYVWENDLEKIKRDKIK